MAVREQTVIELTANAGKRYADQTEKSWSRAVTEVIRGRGITDRIDVAELKRRIVKAGAAHSATKSKAGAAGRRYEKSAAGKIAS